MSLKDKLDRIVDMAEWEKDYYDWLKLPIWEREESDSGHGIDGDGVEPMPEGWPGQPTHAELEKMLGHKLIDLDKLGTPY